MAQKARLRENRYGTVINAVSKTQELELGEALEGATEELIERFGLELTHRKRIFLSEIVEDLRESFPTVEFGDVLPNTFMNPDGGILSITSKDGTETYPILITEVKNQGTNDLRLKEGKKRQSMGNAIERLGKNVIGFRTMMLEEGITPFLCFGYGWDFHEGSSITDRVKTIAMFGELNRISVVPEGEEKLFNRGSFYFRQEAWTLEEMTEVMVEVAARSIHFYQAKYGTGYFKLAEEALWK